MLTEDPIVAALQRSQMIPDNPGNVDLIVQAKIALGAIQAILVGFANFDYDSDKL